MFRMAKKIPMSKIKQGERSPDPAVRKDARFCRQRPASESQGLMPSVGIRTDALMRSFSTCVGHRMATSLRSRSYPRAFFEHKERAV
jgi:hypothetical protein